MERLIIWLASLGFIIFIVLLGSIFLWLYESRAKKRKCEEVFFEREPLDEHTFYNRYFQSSGVPSDVVTKVRRILEEVLDADLSRLKAEDDFAENLSFFFEYDSAAAFDLVLRLEEEFNISITDAEAEKTRTIENIVFLVWSKSK